MSKAEDELLAKILDDKLRLTEDGVVEVYHGGFRRFVRKKSRRHPVSGRYRYSFGSKRGTVYRNRLVWMIANRQAVPTGYCVEHKDGVNTNDDPSNLELMRAGESHAQGNDVQTDLVLDRLSRWFEFVGEHGREPESVAEVAWVETGF